MKIWHHPPVAAGRGLRPQPVGDPTRAEAHRGRGCQAWSHQQQVPATFLFGVWESDFGVVEKPRLQIIFDQNLFTGKDLRTTWEWKRTASPSTSPSAWPSGSFWTKCRKTSDAIFLSTEWIFHLTSAAASRPSASLAGGRWYIARDSHYLRLVVAWSWSLSCCSWLVVDLLLWILLFYVITSPHLCWVWEGSDFLAYPLRTPLLEKNRAFFAARIFSGVYLTSTSVWGERGQGFPFCKNVKKIRPMCLDMNLFTQVRGCEVLLFSESSELPLTCELKWAKNCELFYLGPRSSSWLTHCPHVWWDFVKLGVSSLRIQFSVFYMQCRSSCLPFCF